MTFKELGLNEDILSSITEMGYESPTPIQEQAIPYLLENDSDLVGLASTGTGKTAAFGLPMLNQIDVNVKNVQGLVICPTRELCLQISKDMEKYAANVRGLKVTAVYGGTDIIKQIRTIERGVHIVVATPGRLVDLIKRKKVNISKIKTVVLDEADEMLNMGFKEDIDSILEVTPQEKSVWLFSATMPKDVARIAKNYMTDPFEITVGGKNETNKNIEHHYYSVKERDRYNALKRIIDFNPEIYGLIFCRTRRDTAAVADKLMQEGYNAEPLHGDLSQAQRDRVMEKFRDKTLQILVATDVAARGIDVDDITHVIHYQLPEDVENYTHRSGRTARAGKKGVSIALINTREGRKIKSIENIIKSKFAFQEIPAPGAICEKQLLHLVDKITEVEVNDKEIEKYIPSVMEKLGEFTKEEIITKFVSAEFNRFLNYYSKASNINASQDRNARDDDGGRRNSRDRDRGERSDRGSRGERGERSDRSYDNSNQQRFFVNLGKKDGFNHGALLRLVCDSAGLSKTNVGKIDILNNFSFFEADNAHTSTIIDALKSVDFEGKEMNVEVTNSGSKSSGGGRSPRSGGGERREFGKGRDSRGGRSGGNSGSSSRRSYNR
ncbi:ATP-dependent helicase [Putridiphycobacter roseus]|uniref:DEAD-box ATP-dependent RNA helicase RhpA n=1 Tax=Putridiphycobacter roseus TaxID=2219161 RepID=A0A2W1NSJ1_9FLAO|nr:DEAD/DEAH box helicase [Putridiphycobacter roseus]PZE17648.1 ATP-dependent helicase [Putridiphycobacter roseus]